MHDNMPHGMHTSAAVEENTHMPHERDISKSNSNDEKQNDYISKVKK